MPGSPDRCSGIVLPKNRPFCAVVGCGLGLRRGNSAPFEDFFPVRQLLTQGPGMLVGRSRLKNRLNAPSAPCDCLQARQMLHPGRHGARHLFCDRRRAAPYASRRQDGGTLRSTSIVPALQAVVPGDVMSAVPGATDALVVASVEALRDLVLTVPDADGGSVVVWELFLEPLDGGRTRLIVRGRASSHWLDLARAEPPAGRRRIVT